MENEGLRQQNALLLQRLLHAEGRLQNLHQATPLTDTRVPYNVDSFGVTNDTSLCHPEEVLAAVSEWSAPEQGLPTVSLQRLEQLYSSSQAALALSVVTVSSRRNSDTVYGCLHPQLNTAMAGAQINLVWSSYGCMPHLGVASRAEVASKLHHFVSTDLSVRRHVGRVVKDLTQGVARAGNFWHVMFYQDQLPQMCQWWVVPCIYKEGGSSHWAILHHMNHQAGTDLKLDVLLRDHLCFKYVPSKVTLVGGDGFILSQNSSSVAALGFQAQENTMGWWYSDSKFNYFRELFKDNLASYQEMLSQTHKGEAFRRRMRIQSSLLLSWLGARSDVWHDVQISLTAERSKAAELYVVVQVDVSDVVLAEQRLFNIREQEAALLQEILPQPVIDRLLASLYRSPEQSGAPSDAVAGGMLLSTQDVHDLATYHEEVTIMFADIRGFTAMSQSVHPSQVMQFLNVLYSAFDALLDLHDVYKVETVGDAYMVAGGLMSPATDTHEQELGGHDPLHAQKVLSFARAIVDVCRDMRMPTGERVEVRIGLHSGPCMSGVVGQKMPRFCLFGDTINTASRMESTGVAMKIHASTATAFLLPHEPWQPTGGVYAKGKGILETMLLDPCLTSLAAEPAADGDGGDSALTGHGDRPITSPSSHRTLVDGPLNGNSSASSAPPARSSFSGGSARRGPNLDMCGGHEWLAAMVRRPSEDASCSSARRMTRPPPLSPNDTHLMSDNFSPTAAAAPGTHAAAGAPGNSRHSSFASSSAAAAFGLSRGLADGVEGSPPAPPLTPSLPMPRPADPLSEAEGAGQAAKAVALLPLPPSRLRQ